MGNTLLWLTLSGALFAAGIVMLARGYLPKPTPLALVFQRLEETPEPEPQYENLIAKMVVKCQTPLLPGQARLLQLKGVSPAKFFTEKIALAAVGLFAPTVIAILGIMFWDATWWFPPAAAVLGMTVGFFWPDIQLWKNRNKNQSDSCAALFTFFDLVTLERLANRSATQALTSAAHMSDLPLFQTIRTALDTARLEQRAPYPDLAELADTLQLPQLADIADVLRLEETGASLAEVLQDRVDELRNAHLTDSKIQAHSVSERMTVWMVIPALIFGLIFLVPPLLRLMS